MILIAMGSSRVIKQIAISNQPCALGLTKASCGDYALAFPKKSWEREWESRGKGQKVLRAMYGKNI